MFPDAVDTIAEKHVSLNVLPEHYPMVGQSLLKAIKDTLEGAATKEILEGWSEGYFFLANLLIQTEASKRKQKTSKQNGINNMQHTVPIRYSHLGHSSRDAMPTSCLMSTYILLLSIETPFPTSDFCRYMNSNRTV